MVTKDCWDKAEIVAKVLLPIVVVVLGFLLQSTLKSRDVEVQYVEIAVGILSSPPTEDSRALREWAVESLVEFAEVKPSREVQEQLLQRGLPRVLTGDDGEILTDDQGRPLTTD